MLSSFRHDVAQNTPGLRALVGNTAQGKGKGNQATAHRTVWPLQGLHVQKDGGDT